MVTQPEALAGEAEFERTLKGKEPDGFAVVRYLGIRGANLSTDGVTDGDQGSKGAHYGCVIRDAIAPAKSS